MHTLRLILVPAALVALILAAATGAVSAPAKPFPATISLPAGFQPEGIAIRGQTFYVGSIPTGAVYSGSLRTGTGDVLVEPVAGRAAIGVALDSQNRLFVAGGMTGHAYVYDARSGDLVRDYTLTTAAGKFINDVVVTKDAVFFTDSVNKVLYKLDLGAGGSLPAGSTTLPLTGDLVYTMGFNVNGIDASPSGGTLILVQSNTGFLFRANPTTGVTDRIELAGGALVERGDGILLDGKTLYVVQNTLNKIAIIRLAADLGSGRVTSEITSASFDVPTTIDEHGNRLYAVNARFRNPPQPPLVQPAAYTVVKLRKR